MGTHGLQVTLAALLLEIRRSDDATSLRTGHLHLDSMKYYKHLAGRREGFSLMPFWLLRIMEAFI